jgi:serine/threonine protein kinase
MGQGGMGVILKATDTLLNLDVAMKIMAIDNTGMNAARLQREAMACGSLKHSGIARIYEFGQTPDGSPYMVMELLAGLNLAQYIEKHDLLTYQAALPILRQIATVLEFAHQNGIVHRDLKPSNIMLVEQMSGDFQVKLLDFGVAQTEQQSKTLTATGIMVGSPLYASPEQAHSEDLDHRTDIYSFGCLMYECLSGKPPFMANSALETLALHKKAKPALLSSVLPPKSIPMPLVELIDKCLQKDRDKRPQSMQEIRDQLASIENASSENIVLNSDIIKSKKKWALITLAGCVLTLICWIIYTQPFVKPVVVKAVKQSKNNKLIGSNWETFKNYRRGKEDKSFQIIEGDGYKVAQNAADDIKDEDLKQLRNANIEGLHLIGCSIRGTGFKHLPTEQIRFLELQNSPIDDECLKNISELKNLKILKIDSSNVTDQGLSHLNRLKLLETLSLSCPALTDTGIATLNLPRLRRLTLLSPNITGTGLSSLKKSPDLSRAFFCCSAFKDDVGTILSQFPKLQLLEFSGVKLSKDSLLAIAHLKPLLLKLKDTKISSDEFEVICNISSLTQLDFTDTPVVDSDFAKLSRLKKLYNLDFSGDRIVTDELINYICSMKITLLDLSRTSISDRQLRLLIKAKTLQNLRIRDCENLSSDAIADFERDFKNINKIDIVLEAAGFLERGFESR